MSRSASTFQPRYVPEVGLDRRAFGAIERRFEDRVRLATDSIGRGTYTGPDRRSVERRAA